MVFGFGEHPLKGAPMVGAQLRYLIRNPGVGFSGPSVSAARSQPGGGASLCC